ncbi:hypothetical protein PTKIN_Ptkin03bG0184000 [Pterospermum kingtungense]
MPRPYVFERKVWHSERHQPMRGTLIQEIFRIVNEVHSSSTKKNKEWQEKLPVVVLKAEEILYSRANSEAEYMDLKTLANRMNDAIDTIIRRDQSTETGKLLQPCIEAALILGCTARRTSRSERNSNTRCYLSPSIQEAENALNVTNPCLASYIGFMKPTNMNVTHVGSESQKHIAEKTNFPTNKFPFASVVGPFPTDNQNCSPVGKYHHHPNSYPVYPLYHGNRLKYDEPQHGFRTFPKSIPSKAESSKTAQFLTHDNLTLSDVDFSNKMNLTDSMNTCNNQDEMDCDLSLRLGPISTPCQGAGSSRRPEIEGSGSTSFNTFPWSNNRVDPLNSSSNAWSVESGHMNLDAAMRKRKTVYGPTVNRQIRLPPKLPYFHFTGRMRNAGP